MESILDFTSIGKANEFRSQNDYLTIPPSSINSFLLDVSEDKTMDIVRKYGCITRSRLIDNNKQKPRKDYQFEKAASFRVAPMEENSSIIIVEENTRVDDEKEMKMDIAEDNVLCARNKEDSENVDFIHNPRSKMKKTKLFKNSLEKSGWTKKDDLPNEQYQERVRLHLSLENDVMVTKTDPSIGQIKDFEKETKETHINPEGKKKSGQTSTLNIRRIELNAEHEISPNCNGRQKIGRKSTKDSQIPKYRNGNLKTDGLRFNHRESMKDRDTTVAKKNTKPITHSPDNISSTLSNEPKNSIPSLIRPLSNSIFSFIDGKLEAKLAPVSSLLTQAHNEENMEITRQQAKDEEKSKSLKNTPHLQNGTKCRVVNRMRPSTAHETFDRQSGLNSHITMNTLDLAESVLISRTESRRSDFERTRRSLLTETQESKERGRLLSSNFKREELPLEEKKDTVTRFKTKEEKPCVATNTTIYERHKLHLYVKEQEQKKNIHLESCSEFLLSKINKIIEFNHKRSLSSTYSCRLKNSSTIL